MHLNEKNVLLLVGAGFSLDGATTLVLTIDKPGNSGTVTVTPPDLQIGMQLRNYPLTTLMPTEYVMYALQPGDAPVVGQYLCHLKYVGPIQGQTVAHSSFTVTL